MPPDIQQLNRELPPGSREISELRRGLRTPPIPIRANGTDEAPASFARSRFRWNVGDISARWAILHVPAAHHRRDHVALQELAAFTQQGSDRPPRRNGRRRVVAMP
jgi:hypothetical protein